MRTDPRREAAIASFWRESPLVDAFRRATGKIEVPLKELIAFARSLPESQFQFVMRSN